MTSDIDKTLTERGTRYGEFPEHARITQNLKAAMVDSPNWSKLEPDQKEALEMIVHKVGRILNGDPNYHDSWHDINGYCKLVADRLLRQGVKIEPTKVESGFEPPDVSKFGGYFQPLTIRGLIKNLTSTKEEPEVGIWAIESKPGGNILEYFVDCRYRKYVPIGIIFKAHTQLKVGKLVAKSLGIPYILTTKEALNGLSKMEEKPET
jgi:hypothetical protein